METRDKQAFQRAYVENQAILEPIPLYRAFYLPMWLKSGFFLSSAKIKRYQDKKTLSKEKKIALTRQKNQLGPYQTQKGNGEPNW